MTSHARELEPELPWACRALCFRKTIDSHGYIFPLSTIFTKDHVDTTYDSHVVRERDRFLRGYGNPPTPLKDNEYQAWSEACLRLIAARPNDRFIELPFPETFIGPALKETAP